MIYDASMPLRDGMPFYTGSTAFQRVLTHELAKGQPVNESRLIMGAHNGTHIDAPLHFEKDGFSADKVPLENLIGPARVIHFPWLDRIDAADLAPLDWQGVERVLFRTRNSEHWATGAAFDPNFVYLTGDGAKFLVERNLRLVGIDSLGIEQFGNKEHPAHHTLLRKGVTILEGLYLVSVPPGDYTMFCGALRLMGSDGAPARVFLTT